MKIAFDRRLGVGDIIATVPALWAIKELYPSSKLTLITTQAGFRLCKNYKFIDKIIVASDTNASKQSKNQSSGQMSDENLAQIFSEYGEDVLLLGERTSKNIKIAKQSKCAKIITWRHLHSLFSPRFKHPKHIKRSQRLEMLRCLDLVREIDPGLYNEKFGDLKLENLELSLIIDKENQDFIEHFLQDIKASDYQKIIVLNCFGISSAHYNFTMQDWILMVENLAKAYPQILFIFSNFSRSGFEFKPFKAQNIKVFKDDDLLSLSELLRRCDLVVSISTGNAHIADNLKKDILGLFGKGDEILFRCGNFNNQFEVLFLPKDWEKDYQKYRQEFEKLFQKNIEMLLQN